MVDLSTVAPEPLLSSSSCRSNFPTPSKSFNHTFPTNHTLRLPNQLPRLLKFFYHPPMSRTVADATRFTAASPHAYSRPSSILRSANATFSPSSYSASGSAASQSRRPPLLSNKKTPQQQPPSKPPQHETPAQKVARLRALRAAEKLKPLSLWDRTVVRGRRWADVAHRTTAFGLMGFTRTYFPSPSP